MPNKKTVKFYGALRNTAFCLDAVEFLSTNAAVSSLDLSECYVLPGFCDVHVHFREPGFLYKETIESGSKAAARGGYTAVCTMPNLIPVPDSVENLKPQLDAIEKSSIINVYPYGSITKGQKGDELSDFSQLSENVVAFSDDGRGVQNEEMMRKAMEKAKSLDKIIVAHCEVNDLLKGGYIHDGEYAKAHGHKGICSASEYEQIERDLFLAQKTGCKYHVCHISAKESVELIRKAKQKGVDVTCETAPHYLILDDSMLQEDGRFKMNPPIRSTADKKALIEGIIDGTIDMIATDHAPHSAEEKSRGLAGSLFGIVGLEIAFPLLHTYLIKNQIINENRLLDLLVYNPRDRFNIPMKLDFSVWDLSVCEAVDKNSFLSLGKATPFEGDALYGKNLLTVCDGKIIYKTSDNI